MFFTLSLWMVVAVFRILPTSTKMGPSLYDWDPIENHTNYNLLFWGKDCGEQLINRDPVSYIAGANEVKQGQYPWVVLLKPYRCAGSILNKWWILTAAKCRIATEVLFQYIDAETLEPGPNAQTRGVAQIIVHDSYTLKDNIPVHDIMLLRVVSEIEFTTYIQPICMVPPGYRHCLDESRGVRAVGWGREGPERRKDNVARSLYMHMVHYNTCIITVSYEGRRFDPNYQLCTQYTFIDGVKGALCDGDTGTPLFKITEVGATTSRAYQLGVFTHGAPLCTSPNPEEHWKETAVYSKLSFYILWILDNIKDVYVRPTP